MIFLRPFQYKQKCCMLRNAKRLCITILMILFLQPFLNGQNRLSLTFATIEDSVYFAKNVKKQFSFEGDSNFLIQNLTTFVQKQRDEGFLESSLDTFFRQDTTFWKSQIHIGKQYSWSQLKPGNVPTPFLNAIGFNEKFFKRKVFNINEIRRIQENILTYSENHGYPFAQVKLDSIQLYDGNVTATLRLDLGALMTIARLETEGTSRLSLQYLENYLDIRKGMIFNKSKIFAISKLLITLPFVLEKAKPLITFRGTDVIIRLFLDNKPANNFDGILGIQPQTNLINGGQKFVITATGQAALQNSFNNGEKLSAQIEQLSPQSPKLVLNANFPYLLNLPFGADGAFSVLKQDTTWLDVRGNVGVQYRFSGEDYLKGFWESTNLYNLTINEKHIIETHQLPDRLDVNINAFGVEYRQQRLDYAINPRHGWAVTLRASAGLRQVRQNTSIITLKDPFMPDFDFSHLYDTITRQTYQYKINTNFEYYVSFLQRSVLKLGLQSGLIFTSSPIAINEQYRIGGAKVLRGFDELSIFATRYLVSTLEYRLLLGKNNYLYAYCDVGAVENKTRNTQKSDIPIGFGGGLTFETPVGLFGFGLGVGREQGNVIDFRNIKTHFGYVRLF
jgi:Haemolysin secretion/activation protein ShlB/FhaC/HecB